MPSFLENFVPKMKYIPNEVWHPEQVKFVNHRYDIWSWRSWPEIKNLARLRLKIVMYPIFMKSCTQNKSNMLIMNILTGIDDFDQIL